MPLVELRSGSASWAGLMGLATRLGVTGRGAGQGWSAARGGRASGFGKPPGWLARWSDWAMGQGEGRSSGSGWSSGGEGGALKATG